jgi:DNA repair photolyase
LTREALRLLVKGGFKILLITKSSLVLRDIDIIKGGPCSVSVSLTTLEDGAAMKLEPLAPPPSERLKALKALTSAGVPCSVRIDPLIPGVNSDSNMLEMLVRKAWEAGVSHIVASTYKARADSFKRLISAFPEVQEKLKELYWAMGEVKGRTRYLPKKQRVSLLRELSEVVEKYGLTYATCREGALNLTTAESCDGSHLIKTAHDRLGW